MNRTAVTTVTVTAQPTNRPVKTIHIEKDKDYLEKCCYVNKGSLGQDGSWIKPDGAEVLAVTNGRYGEFRLKVWCDPQEVGVGGLQVFVDGGQTPQLMVGRGLELTEETLTFEGATDLSVKLPFGHTTPTILTKSKFFDKHMNIIDAPTYHPKLKKFYSPVQCFGQIRVQYQAHCEKFRCLYGNGADFILDTAFTAMQAAWLTGTASEVSYPEVRVMVVSNGHVSFFNTRREFRPYVASFEIWEKLEILRLEDQNEEKKFVKYRAWPEGTTDKSDTSKATTIVTPYKFITVNNRTGSTDIQTDDYSHIPPEDIIGENLTKDEL